MAVIGTDDDEDTGSGTDQGQGNIIATGGSGGSGYVGSGGQGATTTTAPSPAGTSSGNFTNLQSYLGANGDAAQATGNAAAGTLNTGAANATNATNAFGSAAQNDIDTAGANTAVSQANLDTINSGIAKTDQNTLNAIKAGGQGTSYSGPTSFTSNYANPTLDTTGWSNYSGPKSSTDYSAPTSALQSTADQAVQKAGIDGAQAQNGFSGLSSLLKSTYQQPQYTQGENSLDAFLVNGTPGANQTVSSAAQNEAAAPTAYSTLNQNLANSMQGYEQKATDAQTAYGQALTKAEGDTTAANAYNSAVTSAKANALANQKQSFQDQLGLAASNFQTPNTTPASFGYAPIQKPDVAPMTQNYGVFGSGKPINPPVVAPVIGDINTPGGYSQLMNAINKNYGAGV